MSRRVSGRKRGRIFYRMWNCMRKGMGSGEGVKSEQYTLGISILHCGKSIGYIDRMEQKIRMKRWVGSSITVLWVMQRSFQCELPKDRNFAIFISLHSVRSLAHSSCPINVFWMNEKCLGDNEESSKFLSRAVVLLIFERILYWKKMN